MIHHKFSTDIKIIQPSRLCHFGMEAGNNQSQAVESKAEQKEQQKAQEKMTPEQLDAAKAKKAQLIDQCTDKAKEIQWKIQDHMAQNPEFRGKGKEMLAKLDALTKRLDGYKGEKVNEEMRQREVTETGNLLAIQIMRVGKEYGDTLRSTTSKQIQRIGDMLKKTGMDFSTFINTLRERGHVNIGDNTEASTKKIAALLANPSSAQMLSTDQAEDVTQSTERLIDEAEKDAVIMEKLQSADTRRAMATMKAKWTEVSNAIKEKGGGTVVSGIMKLPIGKTQKQVLVAAVDVYLDSIASDPDKAQMEQMTRGLEKVRQALTQPLVAKPKPSAPKVEIRTADSYKPKIILD